MAVNRASIVDEQFTRTVAALHPGPRRTDLDAPVRHGSTLPGRLALSVFESMVQSRHLDLAARELKARDQGYYTIGSSGHECNAAVATAARPTDPAFLHYRSGGFYCARARQVPGQTPLQDVMLGIVASSDDPISGGRHKVFGSLPLQIPPQTSTIASHLPKAVGTAFTISRRRRLGLPAGAVPHDSIVLCSFGDASSNHASASTAFNAAAIADYQKLPCPILFVCEDNGIGISVRTPGGWIEARFRPNPGLKYFQADGLDLVDSYDTARAAVDFVRRTRRPAFLHLRLVRLLGHAGSDVEQSYRSPEEIEAAEAKDPVLAAARTLVEEGWLTPDETLSIYEETRARCMALADEVVRRPRLTSAREVMAPLAPHQPEAVAAAAAIAPDPAAREAFHGRLPELDRPRHLAVQINRALGDALLAYPEMLIFGEDVARKGGVYHVTADLQKKAGVGRVFNTPLDETSILGLALGAGQLGMLPVPEIQYLAYLHNAVDQLRGEAGSLQYFSNGQFRNPMVVRIAGLAYQKGFGGHFHNDNGIAALLEVPGLRLACPSNGRDAVGMLRSLLASARVDGTVCAFLEPIALYMTKDLYEDKDGRWSFTYPAPGTALGFDEVGVRTPWAEDVSVEWEGTDHPVPAEGGDVTVLSFANGYWMSLRVARQLAAQGLKARVVDLRWLKPLPEQAILEQVRQTGRCLVVDECREHSGIAEELVSLVARHEPSARVERIVACDTYIPLGGAANLVLLQEDDIRRAMLAIAP